MRLQANGAALMLIVGIAAVGGVGLLGMSKEGVMAASGVVFALFAAGVLGLSPRV